MAPNFEDFEHWFVPTQNGFDIIRKSDNEVLGTTWLETDEIMDFDMWDHSMTEHTICQTEFKQFHACPEYSLLWHHDCFSSIADQEARYNTLLEGVMRVRAFQAGQNPDDYYDYYHRVLDYLASTDFYRAPASTRFHEAFEGGLAYHSIMVFENMQELIKIPKFARVNFASAALVCLVHDWCKINLYESYNRNVKDDETGKWSQVKAFKTKDIEHPFGHGTTSMYNAMKFFKLTEEEALAIRWHMGAWYVCDSEMNDLQKANETYPLVHLLQFADQLAITNYDPTHL